MRLPLNSREVLQVNNTFTHLEELENVNLAPRTAGDEKTIKRLLKRKFPLCYDTYLRVFTETNVYVADLKEVE